MHAKIQNWNTQHLDTYTHLNSQMFLSINNLVPLVCCFKQIVFRMIYCFILNYFTYSLNIFANFLFQVHEKVLLKKKRWNGITKKSIATAELSKIQYTQRNEKFDCLNFKSIRK